VDNDAHIKEYIDEHPLIDNSLLIRSGFPTLPEIPLGAIVLAPPLFFTPCFAL
jgi:hypothetical protein